MQRSSRSGALQSQGPGLFMIAIGVPVLRSGMKECRIVPGHETAIFMLAMLARSAGARGSIKDRQSSAHYLLTQSGNDEQQARWGTLMKTMLAMARLAVLAGALALTGCVTTENSLSANDIAAMKLTGETVSYAPDSYIQ